MVNNLQIIPGVLEKDWESIEKRLNEIKTFTNSAHIDIIDGKFANNLTFLDPKPFRKYSKDLFLELHMMVENPINLLPEWGKAGFKRFLGHIEHMSSQNDFLNAAREYGEAGLAIDGPTHISSIKVPFDQIDCLLVYTSDRVGFSGPPLMDDRLDKIRALRKLTNLPIEADGGVNDRTIVKARDAGATRFVSTSFITSSEKYHHLEELLG
ncbi:MAG TPA: hypothetical protein VG917_02425 [Patescibacteria group bacterium]|nr:hypothetical protein [Patescibacteria group bacterium]